MIWDVLAYFCLGWCIARYSIKLLLRLMEP